MFDMYTASVSVQPVIFPATFFCLALHLYEYSPVSFFCLRAPFSPPHNASLCVSIKAIHSLSAPTALPISTHIQPPDFSPTRLFLPKCLHRCLYYTKVPTEQCSRLCADMFYSNGSKLKWNKNLWSIRNQIRNLSWLVLTYRATPCWVSTPRLRKTAVSTAQV